MKRGPRPKYGGMTMCEIASILKVSERTVRNDFNRAIKKLKSTDEAVSCILATCYQKWIKMYEK